MGNVVIVGISDMNIVKPPGIITTLGLGSCIGITLYDKVTKLGGLVHVMLPSSAQVRENSNRAKFADTGILDLYNKMLASGSKKMSLQAKIAGGAHMFGYAENSDVMKIGKRNYVFTKEILAKLGVPLLAEDCGGTVGRTIELHTETGMLLVKTVAKGSKFI